MRSPVTALAALSVRSCRTSAVTVVVSVAGLMAAGLAAVSSLAALQAMDLTGLVDNPAIRALYGVAYDLSSPGGFVVWRYGQVLAVVTTVWAALVTTRLLRGDEEKGRSDLVLVGVTTRRTWLAAAAGVVVGVGLTLGVAVTLVFLVDGQPLTGSVLFGAGMALVTIDVVAIAAVTSQVFAQRRRAAGAAVWLVSLAFAARMLADASGSQEWLRWTTPFGWLEALEPFAADRVLPLVPLLVAPSGLFVVAALLVDRRDLGDGLWRDADTAPTRRRGLGGATGFAWRLRAGGVVVWSVGMAAFGLLIGAITGAFTDFISTSTSFQQMVSSFGMASLGTAAGFVATMDTFVAVFLAAYAISSVHLLWDDEGDGRLDLVYATPLGRARWFGGAVWATIVATLVLGAVTTVTTWAGVAIGGSSLSLPDTAIGVLNVVPVVALFLGLALLCHGLAPGWTVGVTAGLLGATYVLTFVGPALDWPDWVLGISPFHHVSVAPAEPVDLTATAVLVGLAVAAGLIGLFGYSRRDLQLQ